MFCSSRECACPCVRACLCARMFYFPACLCTEGMVSLGPFAIAHSSPTASMSSIKSSPTMSCTQGPASDFWCTRCCAATAVDKSPALLRAEKLLFPVSALVVDSMLLVPVKEGSDPTANCRLCRYCGRQKPGIASCRKAPFPSECSCG